MTDLRGRPKSELDRLCDEAMANLDRIRSSNDKVKQVKEPNRRIRTTEAMRFDEFLRQHRKES
jgi:hypothetical protein